MRLRFAVFTMLVTATLGAASCNNRPGGPRPTLTGDALRDPTSCLPCHDEQFREWSSSMHAYAAEDPVFIAMNKRMLRETGGASGDFCVGCHAPMALRLGLTRDGSNLAELPNAVLGVTCYFCHAADAVEGTHNNPIRLAEDGVMRGGIRDPIAAMPHRGVYSPLHDRETAQASTLCGACHDVITPHGAHIERTFDEWKASLYAKPGGLTCGKCHMDGRDEPAAAVEGAPIRKVHDHSMPAVDIALTPFFGAEGQRAAVQRLLDTSLITKLCVTQTPLGPIAAVTLDNAFAGHEFPSGASQDRRLWVELHAYERGALIFSSGLVQPLKAASKVADPDFWLLRDRIFRTDGQETHLFWEAARVEQNQLPAAVTADPRDPAFIHSVTRTYTLPSIPDRVTMRVHMRPLDFDLLDDLVGSGDLDSAVLAKVPTFDLASGNKEWTSTIGFARCVD